VNDGYIQKMKILLHPPLKKGERGGIKKERFSGEK